jgi:RNA polymerase sigma-70 factor (ECF subfamily)
MVMNPSRDVFDAFYRKHVRLVFATALSQGLDSQLAEDATQEAFIRVWRHLSEILCLELPAQRAWLMTTTRNIAHTTRRKQKEKVSEADVTANEPGACGHETKVALRLDVVAALAQLSDEDRAIVVLRYFMERNSREIGEILEIPEGTVRRRLATCRQRLAVGLAAWQADTNRENDE